jgi:hypothetical protein
MPQLQLPIFPAGTTAITSEVAFDCQEGKVTYLNGHLPVFQHGQDDLPAFRLFTSQLVVNGTVSQAEIARAHVENRLSMRLDLFTHCAPPLQFPCLPLCVDAASVTALPTALSFVEPRTTDLSNVGCIADEQTTGVGSISAGPAISPSAPPASSKYRCCASGVSSAWARGCAD